jgi:uncharacterized protein YdeI (YjbR/CyaY-like superfamily)
MNEAMQFSNRRQFRDWLANHCTDSPGIWLLFGKKGGPVTLSANDALEEALCHGWIDGQMQKIDAMTYKKYFARRTRSSNWSEKNKKLAQRLIEKGIMDERGMQAIEAAKRNGAWDKPNRPVITGKDIENFKALLQEYDAAYQNYLSMPPSVQKSYTGLYLDAKSEATRKTRLARIVDRLNRNLKPM